MPPKCTATYKACIWQRGLVLSMFPRYMHTLTLRPFHNTIRKRLILAAAHATSTGIYGMYTPRGIVIENKNLYVVHV